MIWSLNWQVMIWQHEARSAVPHLVGLHPRPQVDAGRVQLLSSGAHGACVPLSKLIRAVQGQLCAARPVPLRAWERYSGMSSGTAA